ncbi:MAG TPA: DedA family protein [Candidatus Kapabacteria bacterium]|nr:DedA family protein [Candidatus Kapabacteria bacterium]
MSVITAGIHQGGYAGIFILMTMESMVFPVPSELIMPFAGFLILSKEFSIAGVLAASSIGSISGSVISYYIGSKGGRPAVLKVGKYLLLDESHLDQTERFFSKYGEKAIFFARFIPVVRHLISIPAGIGKMDLTKFIIYTVAGATLWNMILAFAGIQLGERWELIHQYSRILDIIIVCAAVIAGVYIVRKHIVRARANAISKS